jgi:hypothetical protein
MLNNALKIVCLCLIAMTSCYSGSKEPNNQKYKGEPKLVIQPENHNFGNLEAGDVISFSFKIENRGQNVLTIDSIVADCGCIDVGIEKTELLPNGLCYMQVTYNSAGDWGNIVKTVRLYSNDSIACRTILIGAYVENQIFN